MCSITSHSLEQPLPHQRKRLLPQLHPLGFALCLDRYTRVPQVHGKEVHMARVFGIHELTLKADANVAEFERFVSDEFNTMTSPLPGWTVSIVKGDRGDNVGNYLLMLE